MTTKPETRFTNAVHDQLPNRRRFYRMKNDHRATSGIADWWYSGEALDLWVEYKWVELKQAPESVIKIGLSDLQMDWLNERYKERRNVCVIVGHQFGPNKFGTVFVHGAWRSNAVYQAKLIAHTYPVKELAQWLMDQCLVGFYKHSVKPIGASNSAFKWSSALTS